MDMNLTNKNKITIVCFAFLFSIITVCLFFIIKDGGWKEDFGLVENVGAKPQKTQINNGMPITERNWNSYTSQQGNVKTSQIHSKWVNYLDEAGWKDIDTVFIPTTGGFTMTEAPFEVFVPEFSDGTATFHNNNRYDIWNKSIIDELAFDMFITAQGVNVVQGQIETGALMTAVGYLENISYVVYPNAYADADLIYYVHHGTAPRLEKLIRFHSKPSVFAYTFEIGVAEDVEISRKDLQGVWQEWRNRNKKLSFNGSDKLSIKRVGSNTRGVGFKPFEIWDSNMGFMATATDATERNIQTIDIEIDVASPSSVYLTKVLPEAFFDTATYPVYTDTESTFNPDADAESTSMDAFSAYQLSLIHI